MIPIIAYQILAINERADGSTARQLDQKPFECLNLCSRDLIVYL